MSVNPADPDLAAAPGSASGTAQGSGDSAGRPVAVGSLVATSGSETRRRFRGKLSLGVVGLLIFIGITAPLIAPYGFTEINAGPPLEGPSWPHLMGTDQFGRDVFSRVLGGARISLGVAFASVLAAGLVGSTLGALAARMGGWRDELLMRAMDVLLSFPGILLAIVIGAVLGGGAGAVIVAISVLYVPQLARVVRAAVLKELREDYIAAARLLGASERRILVNHVGINAAVPVVVFATTILADAILLEAALAFIGVGIPPPSPSWGNIIAQGQEFIFNGAWWLTVFPGLAIFITVLSLIGVTNLMSQRYSEDISRG